MAQRTITISESAAKALDDLKREGRGYQRCDTESKVIVVLYG